MAIELRNVSFAYPNGFLAVDGVSMTINRGEKVAIVGQNGAGKTTTVKLMNGIHRPSQGDVLVEGIDTKTKTTASLAKYVGYVFQNPDDQIFNQTVLAEIQYMLRRVKMSEEEIQRRTERALELTHLTPLQNENPYELPLPIRKFLTIAAVIATEPQYIILDEPTAGQDRRGNQILRDLINTLTEEGMGIITISHDMEFVAANFDRVIAMAHKNVIMDGPVREVFWQDDILAESRIKRPEICQVAELLGYREDKIMFCRELVEKIKSQR